MAFAFRAHTRCIRDTLYIQQTLKQHMECTFPPCTCALKSMSTWIPKLYRVFRAQADWTLTHTSHKDTDQSVMETSITLDGVTLTDSLIRWSPNKWPSVCREIPQCLPIRRSGRLIRPHSDTKTAIRLSIRIYLRSYILSHRKHTASPLPNPNSWYCAHRIISERWTGKICGPGPNLRYHSSIFLDGQRITTKNLSRWSGMSRFQQGTS
jgi:hypothetical protein